MKDITVEQLKAYVKSTELPCGETVEKGLEYSGLLFWDDLIRYDLTPTNSTPFASTGGDGVHYGTLDLPDATPIVMTVPMMTEPEDEGNRIVGETLHEFLCLGCEVGWFFLEQMVYEPMEEFVRMMHDTYEREGYELEALAAMRKHFDLKLWDDIPGRLAELREKYAGMIEVAPFPWDEE